MSSSRIQQGGHYEGVTPIYQYFGNLLPHFLNPDKQVTFSGNFYAHEMGMGLAEGDNTTGISFSPVAEAFHCEGWGGIFWLLPVIWILLFRTVDFVVGDMTKYPWGLMVVVWLAHGAPEGVRWWHDLLYRLWQLWNDAGDHRGHPHCADSRNTLPGQGANTIRPQAGWRASHRRPGAGVKLAALAVATSDAIDWRCATMKAAAITTSTFSITHE